MTTLERWTALWHRLGSRAPRDRLYAEVMARYREKHRFYHGVDHLDDCLRQLDAHASLAAAPAEVELALWFHDAVYDVRASDNEERSAAWARDAISGAGWHDPPGQEQLCDQRIGVGLQ